MAAISDESRPTDNPPRGGGLARAKWDAVEADARRRGLLTTSQAIARTGRSREVIARWESKGLVTNYGTTGKGAVALWRPDELDEAPARAIELRRQAREVTCSVEDCKEKPHARGMCNPHYMKWRKAAGLHPKSKPPTREQNAAQTLRKGGALNPPRTLPYRVLARTCQECGDLLTTPDDLLRRDSGPLPGCPRCRVARVTRSFKKRIATDDELRQKERRRTDRRRRQKQHELFPSAQRRGYEWTGPELETVAREDLSAEEVARMLGRTFYAVRHMRKKIRTDPRKARLAGLDTDVAKLAD